MGLAKGWCGEREGGYAFPFSAAGGGGTLEGSLGAGVPLSPSNPEHVEDKMILSFRFPVFVTQSPSR